VLARRVTSRLLKAPGICTGFRGERLLESDFGQNGGSGGFSCLSGGAIWVLCERTWATILLCSGRRSAWKDGLYNGGNRLGGALGFIPGGDAIDPIETISREDLQSMDAFGHLLHRLWLLWKIVQEGSEPWEIEARSEMVTLLERIYRTHSVEQRPMRAAAEIQQIELIGASREGGSSIDHELRQFLREVFARLKDALVIDKETNNGR
jgi:hypothetical protein